MDDVTVLRDRLALTDGVTMLTDSAPNGVHFTMDHAISGRSLFFDLINENNWWILSRISTENVKEYKVTNYVPSW